VSSPTDPQPPADPSLSADLSESPQSEDEAPSSTQAIPVPAPAVPAPHLPPHPAATSPSPVPTMQATGPVDFVPGLPGSPQPPPAGATAAGATAAPSPSYSPPPPPPAQDPGPAAAWPDSLVTETVPPLESAEEPVRRKGPDRSSLIVLGLVLASLLLLETGLALRFGGESFWSDIPLWSAFATGCTVLGLAAAATLLPGGRRIGAGTAWRVAAGGLVGLAVFWVLVVLPVVATDRGFLLTAALACLGGALWAGPARRS
jgi:hypothetical protein